MELLRRQSQMRRASDVVLSLNARRITAGSSSVLINVALPGGMRTGTWGREHQIELARRVGSHLQATEKEYTVATAVTSKRGMAGKAYWR